MKAMNSFLIKYFFLCFLAVSFGVASAQGLARPSGLVVNADEMSTDFKAKVTTLKGNIQVVFQGQHLSADRATIDYRNKRIEARGRVRLQSSTVYSEASRLIINYEADTAWLENGFIQSGQVVFEGKEIQKTGPNTYVATDAKYTACASCPPAWEFSGKRIEAELGGYAQISRPVMRIGGIPVIILPGILVPLKSSRQSGLLVPSLDHTGKGGLAFSESFFWAIGPSKDATLTAKYYELRGFKSLAEYRYVLSETSKGQLDGAYMKDRAFANEYKNQLDTSKDVDRWYFKYDHYYELPDNFIHRVNLRQISDLRYLRDFPDELDGHGDPALDNQVSLTKNFTGQHLSAEASFYTNMLKAYPLADNNDEVHRFPEIHYSVTEKRVLGSPLLFSFDGTYTNFTRSGYSYDDLTLAGCPGGLPKCVKVSPTGEIYHNGEFDPGDDFIRTGQRLDLRPSLALPFQVFRIFDVIPRVSYREAQYRFQLDETAADSNFARTAAQRYIETGISTRAKLSHVYGDLASIQAVRLKHEIEPEVGFSSIPWVRRADHSFFGDFADQRYSRIYEPLSDSDLFGRNRLQFDYHDRVFDKKLIEFALTNRITRKRWRGGFPYYQRIGSLRLSQSYDLFEARDEKSQPWSPVNALLNVRVDNFETHTTALHNGYAKVTNTSSRVRVFDARENFVQLSYERIYLINEDNEVTSRNQTKNLGFGAGFFAKYLNFSGQVDYSGITRDIVSWQYIADLKPPGDCWIIRVGYKQVIGGDPELRFNMSFDFGGDEVKKLN
jgi:LPS-assembly protein